MNCNKTYEYIIASHLQPTFARRVFPCFDDPSLQATFEITIIHKDNMNSLSNMPLKNSTNLGDGWIKDQFEISPIMPPFLVAMILLDKQYYSSISGNQNISIWAPKEHLKYASYPLEKTEKILSYYTKHFNMPYPLPKLDIVTIPTLPSTATENWGLIFFKESTLLNGEDEREIFSFLAKKIAQQWFGNLVSIKWWNDLWLVKGFALLEADDASIEINNWNSDFTLRIMQKMLALDDFSPITLGKNITNVLQINQLYDSVTHFKGSCLLRMLEHSISESAFENGTQYFLNRWKYGIVDQKHFWASIGNLVRNFLPQGKNIASIMDTWSSQSGYPLITVIKNRKTNTMQEYIKNLVSPLYDKMQNVTDGHQLLRRLIIETACSVNYEPCADWATNLFRNWMENNITIPYDLRKTIFCTAIKAGGKEEWDYLWAQIRLQKTNNDIEELFMSLGCSRDTWLINKYMRNSHSGTIPWQFVPYVWQSLGQPTSVAFGFKYLRENWDEIYEAYKDKPIILKAIIQDFLYGLGTKSDLEDLTTLVSKHEQDFQQLASLVQGAVDRIKARVDWSNRHLSQIEDLLSN
ncbi:protease m1 zinc metalloprotease [Holotrichia oblita]|uniref:Protease m1 zinc metalloprotease n=1 Tax=Holotrichia oblita TaxID=644536 RepID=A0ACB9SWQ6_HOLOL|nr:protease m1 zinc metalloprotease [Holotrichia oblita]